jgi:hypothetical protein
MLSIATYLSILLLSTWVIALPATTGSQDLSVSAQTQSGLALAGYQNYHFPYWKHNKSTNPGRAITLDASATRSLSTPTPEGNARLSRVQGRGES